MKVQRFVNQKAWTPRRRGAIYCAPACGAGCTKAAFDQANGLAKELAASLGPGWKPDVHENMGWHWSVTNGPIRVFSGSANSFHCLITDREGGHGSLAGRAVWTSEKNWARTPKAAIRLAMAGVRAYAKHIAEAAGVAERACKGLRI